MEKSVAAAQEAPLTVLVVFENYALLVSCACGVASSDTGKLHNFSTRYFGILHVHYRLITHVLRRREKLRCALISKVRFMLI